MGDRRAQYEPTDDLVFHELQRPAHVTHPHCRWCGRRFEISTGFRDHSPTFVVTHERFGPISGIEFDRPKGIEPCTRARIIPDAPRRWT